MQAFAEKSREEIKEEREGERRGWRRKRKGNRDGCHCPARRRHLARTVSGFLNNFSGRAGNGVG